MTARLARFVRQPRVACAALVALQVKVIWGDWQLRELTPGDTADYFVLAAAWYDSLGVNIARSPLYTALYGSLLGVSSDAAVVTYLHRLLIVLASDLLLLVLLRRLLPAWVAWLVAAWWTLLAATFDVTYEVHLFGALPALAAAALALSGRSTLWRGGALASLLLGALLVRNELSIAAAVFGVACLLGDRRRRFGEVAWGYGLPVLGVLLLTAFFYTRSVVQVPDLLNALRAKHTLNVCQVYAFAYHEQHADWSGSPWAGCDQLMLATFGQPRPSLLAALARNPQAMLEQFSWSLRLAPAGLEVALFNATSDALSPDFAPVPTGEPLPRLLALALLGLLAAGGVCVYRDRCTWLPYLRERAWGWLALGSAAGGALVVLIVERPRAEYIYSLTVLILALAGLCAAALLGHWAWSRRLGWLVSAGVVALLAVWPPYYAGSGSVRPHPLLDKYRRLQPFASLVADSHTRFLVGDYHAALGAYLGHRQDTVLDTGLLSRGTPSESLASLLEASGVTLVYLDDPLLASLEADPRAQGFLRNPEARGWRLIALGELPGPRWRLLQKRA